MVKIYANGKWHGLKSDDVTKYEVYPNDAPIEAGTIDADTGLAYAEAVPASMIHGIRVRTSCLDPKNCDVVIDWGDGTTFAIKDITEAMVSDGSVIIFDQDANVGETDYYVKHTYTAAGKKIVSIKGHDYFGLQHGVVDAAHNLMSRCFDTDLPIASCFVNLSNFCKNAIRMQKVLIPTGMDLFTNVINASGLWSGCYNLLSATNFATKFRWTRYVSSMFYDCRNMTTCDFQLPQNAIKKTAYISVYYNCKSLVADIASLLPERGFDGQSIDISRCFYKCVKLTGTVPASTLWNHMTANWVATDCFTGCSDELRAQVPTAWGGTSTTEIAPHPVTRSVVNQLIDTAVDETIPPLVTTSVVAEINKRIKNGEITSSTPEGGTVKLGTGNVTEGYGAIVEEYTGEATGGATAFRMKLRNDADMTKFKAGATLTINECTEDTDSTPETPDDNDGLVWGTFIEKEIYEVDATNYYLYFETAVELKGDPADGSVVVRVIDNTREDSAISMGDRNFVTGEAAFAAGLLNTAGGTGSFVLGSHSTVGGNFSASFGVNSHVGGSNAFSFGGGNTVRADMAMTVGIGNEILKTAQNAIVLGCTNKQVAGIDAIVVGQGNSDIKGNRSITIGFNLDNNLEGAIGLGVSVPNSVEYKSSVNLPGLYFVKYRKELNPLYNVSKDPQGTGVDSDLNAQYITSEDRIKRGYYEGSLKAETSVVNTADLSGVLDLDPQQFSRYRIEGTGSLVLDISDISEGVTSMEDGDKIEVAFDASAISVSFPSEWVAQGEINLTSKSTVLIEVTKVIDTVFYRVIYAKSN